MYKFVALVAAIAATLWAIPAQAYPYVYQPRSGADSVVVVDAASNTILRTLPNLSQADAVAVNPDGTRAYVSGGTTGKVSVIETDLIANPNQDPVIGSYTGLGDVVGLAVGPQGKLLYVADSDSDQVTAIDMPNYKVTGTYQAASPGFISMALDPSGQRLAITSGSGASFVVRLYNLANGAHKDVSIASQPEALLFNSSESTLWIATSQGFVAYDLKTGSQTTTSVSGGVLALAYSPRAQVIYAASLSNPDVYAYPANGGSPATLSIGVQPLAVALSPDGTRAYVFVGSGLEIYDTSNYQYVGSVSFQPISSDNPPVGNLVGPGYIYADNTTFNTAVGMQLSGQVSAGDYQSRPLSYAVIRQPADGTLNFDQSTGAYTYTPPAGSSGVEAFVWEATATSGSGSPTQPRSRPVTATLSVNPVLGTFADQQVDAGSTIGPLSFTLQGSTPLDVTIKSSNANVVDPASAQLSSGCGTSSMNCTLTLTAGTAKGHSATVTVTATDPSGAAGKQTFKVGINGSSGGGGGGGLSWWLFALLALVPFRVFQTRRRHEGL